MEQSQPSSRFEYFDGFFAIQRTDDPDVKIYHSRLALLPEGFMRQASNRGGKRYQMSDGSQGEISELLSMLLQIDGVSYAEMTCYQFALRRSPVFDWAEIDAQVLNILLGVRAAFMLPDLSTQMEERNILTMNKPTIHMSVRLSQDGDKVRADLGTMGDVRPEEWKEVAPPEGSPMSGPGWYGHVVIDGKLPKEIPQEVVNRIGKSVRRVMEAELNLWLAGAV